MRRRIVNKKSLLLYYLCSVFVSSTSIGLEEGPSGESARDRTTDAVYIKHYEPVKSRYWYRDVFRKARRVSTPAPHMDDTAPKPYASVMEMHGEAKESVSSSILDRVKEFYDEEIISTYEPPTLAPSIWQQPKPNYMQDVIMTTPHDLTTDVPKPEANVDHVHSSLGETLNSSPDKQNGVQFTEGDPGLPVFPYFYYGFPFNYRGIYGDYKYGFPIENMNKEANFDCPGMGLYYRDEVSFYACAGGHHSVLFCAPGTRNSAADTYSMAGGTKLAREDFCSVNMVALDTHTSNKVNLHVPKFEPNSA